MADLSWKNKESKVFADCRFFSVHRHVSKKLGSDVEHDFYVLKLSNWANVIAITPEQEVVFVKQYRHGVEKITLETPGGIIDLDDKDPMRAAARELLEETGYQAKELTFVGDYHPNPALQNNICYVYLAKDAIKVSDPMIDMTGCEHVEACLVPLTKVPQMIANGDITHGAVIAAFYLFQLHQNKLSNSLTTNEV